MKEQIDWVSVSTFASRTGQSTQNVYNKIKQGLLKTKEFERGSMRGLLVGIQQTNNSLNL